MSAAAWYLKVPLAFILFPISRVASSVDDLCFVKLMRESSCAASRGGKKEWQDKEWTVKKERKENKKVMNKMTYTRGALTRVVAFFVQFKWTMVSLSIWRSGFRELKAVIQTLVQTKPLYRECQHNAGKPQDFVIADMWYSKAEWIKNLNYLKKWFSKIIW